MSLLFHLICWHGFINKNFKGWSPSARAVKAFSPSAFQWKAFRTPWFIRPKHLIKLSFSCVFISTSCLLLPPTHNHTHAADMSEAQWHSCAVQSDTSPLPLHLNIWCPLWEAQEVGNWGKPFYYHSLSSVAHSSSSLLTSCYQRSICAKQDWLLFIRSFGRPSLTTSWQFIPQNESGWPFNHHACSSSPSALVEISGLTLIFSPYAPGRADRCLIFRWKVTVNPLTFLWIPRIP